jgi:hypothetical protein
MLSTGCRRPPGLTSERTSTAYFHDHQPSPTVTGIFGEPTPVSSRSPGGQKRAGGICGRVQRGWYDRQTAPSARSRLRRLAHLPRRRGAARGLSALHEALRLLRWPARPGVPDPGCGQGVSTRRAHRESARAPGHARATAPGGDPQVPEITHTTSRRAGNSKRHSAPRDPWGGA